MKSCKVLSAHSQTVLNSPCEPNGPVTVLVSRTSMSFRIVGPGDGWEVGDCDGRA